MIRFHVKQIEWSLVGAFLLGAAWAMGMIAGGFALGCVLGWAGIWLGR
jgi:hypothetical protein